MNLHPQVLKKNGRGQFVILPYEEFRALLGLLENAEDVLALRRSRQESAGKPTISFAEMQKELGIRPRRKPAKAKRQKVKTSKRQNVGGG